MIKQTTVEEINDLIQNGADCQVLDVREYSEFSQVRISEARFTPLSNFDHFSASIDHSKPIYLMCRSGHRAQQAAERLAANGFSDINVIRGGMNSWTAADLPVLKSASKTWSLERQVRFIAGLLVLMGVVLGFALSPYFFLLSGFVGAGLTFAGATDWCGMAMVLACMPWNKASGSAGASCAVERQ